MRAGLIDNGLGLLRLPLEADDGNRAWSADGDHAPAGTSLVPDALSNALGIAQRVAAFEMMHGAPAAQPATSLLTPDTGGLQIIVNYDASVNTCPQEAAFKACVAGVVQFYESHFTDPITITIDVGWGEVDGQSIPAQAGAQSISNYTGQTFSYAQIKAAFQGDSKTGDDATAIASLGADPTGGGAKFSMTTAEAKALGLTANNASVDGFTGIDSSTAWTFNTTNTDGSNVPPTGADAFSFLAHEISEIMGRQMDFGTNAGDSVGGDGYYPYDLFDYTSAGHRSFDQNSAARYFSIDGGTTHIHRFGIAADGDPFDWYNPQDGSVTPDSFDAAGSVGVVSTFDLQLMDILGYDPVGTAAKPDLTATGFAFDGALGRFTVANVGNASAGASTTGIYLSTDATVTTADTLLASVSTAALSAGASVALTSSLPLTGAQAPGLYYLAAIADKTGAVSEGNENNNTSNALPIFLDNNDSDIITGTSGNDIIIALGGDDVIAAGAGNDILAGGTGADTFQFTAANLTGADIVNGGNDSALDTLSFTTPGTVAASAFAHVSHIEKIVLANGTNSLAIPDALATSADDSHLLTVIGGTGNDTMNASSVTTSGNHVSLQGGSGTDTFIFTAAGLASGDTVNGGTGAFLDQLLFTTAGTVAVAALSNVAHIEALVLANGTNSIAIPNALAISADDGQVLTVIGGSGNDSVNASAVTTATAVVKFTAGAGNDSFTGGAGADVVSFKTADFDGSDTVNGGTGTALDGLSFTTNGYVTAAAFAGVSHIERIFLSAGASHNLTLSDALVASADDSHFLTIVGNSGNDTINASAVLAGDSVRFEGMGAADRFIAGGGADNFYYFAPSDSTGDANGTLYDTVIHFNPAADRFDLPSGFSVASVSTVSSGSLSGGTGTFDSDMATAIGSALNSHVAVDFHVTAGSLSGQEFLVVNPTASNGYVSGADYVFDVTGHYAGAFTTGDFI